MDIPKKLLTVSLHGTMGSKRYFDIARLLISTNTPGLIWTTITVVSEDSTYQVRVLVESSRESIFSRGNDEDCISEKLYSRSSDDHPNDISSGGDSFIPCLLSRKLNKCSLSSPAEHRSPRGASDSKSVDSNHDNHCRQDPLGQGDCKHVSKEYARPRSGNKENAAIQEGNHVSSSACSSTRALMAEGTVDLKRSKKSDSIGSKADTPFVASRPKGGADFLIADNLGPLSQGPILALDQNLIRPSKPKKKTCKPLKSAASVCLPSDTRPISPGANCTKPKESISNSKKKGSIKNSSKPFSKRGITLPNPKRTDEEQIQTESLHDSNIENVNRIFLNNLSKVMAEEIWEAGNF
ncbi:hypothetical protein Ancab_022452 [Ancistrocladus abbreviatus]